MSEIIEYTRKEFVKYLDSKDKYNSIEELARIFENTDICDDIDGLIAALKEREDIMSTGIGFGIAVPHAKINAVKKMAFAIGISKKGIVFDSIDGEPVHVIIMVAAGEKQHKKYLKLLSNIMSILKIEKIKEKIINSQSADEIIKIFNK
jgi:mannitol/fructose-specific phosphotransferase system IIA component (Ntr-type)